MGVRLVWSGRYAVWPCRRIPDVRPKFLEIGKYVNGFLTVFVLLPTNVDDFSSVCVQLIFIYGLDFFAPVHLVFLQFLFIFILLYGLDSVSQGFISFLPPVSRDDFGILQVYNGFQYVGSDAD